MELVSAHATPTTVAQHRPSQTGDLWADLQTFRKHTIEQMEQLRQRIQCTPGSVAAAAASTAPKERTELSNALELMGADVCHKYTQLLMVAYFCNAYDYHGLCKSVRARRRAEDVHEAKRQLLLQQSIFGGAPESVVAQAHKPTAEVAQAPLLEDLVGVGKANAPSRASVDTLDIPASGSASDRGYSDEEDEDPDIMRAEELCGGSSSSALQSRGYTLDSLMSKQAAGNKRVAPRESVIAFKRRITNATAVQIARRGTKSLSSLSHSDELAPSIPFAPATRETVINPNNPVKAVTRTDLLAQINNFLELCGEAPIGRRDEIWTSWFLRTYLGLTNEEIDSSRKLLLEEKAARLDQVQLAIRVRLVAVGKSADAVLAAYVNERATGRDVSPTSPEGSLSCCVAPADAAPSARPLPGGLPAQQEGATGRGGEHTQQRHAGL